MFRAIAARVAAQPLEDVRQSSVNVRVTARLNQGSTALADDVDASQGEMPGRFQYVAVAGIDLSKAVLFGANQVEGVTRSDEDRAGKVEDGFASLLQKLGSHTKPQASAGCWRMRRPDQQRS